MRRARSAAGYSLVEMMVVLVVIAVVSALVLPGVGQAMRERHVRQASVSVLDVFRQVRGRAMYRGRAQLLVVQTSGSALSFDAWEGDSNSCRLASFGTAGVLDPNQRVVTLDLADPVYSADGINALFSSPAGTPLLQICYTPMGRVFYRTTATGTWTDDTTLIGRNGGFEIDVFQQRSGSDYGVRRHVLIPIGGMPRLRT